MNHLKKRRKLTRNVPLARIVPSWGWGWDEGFPLLVLGPDQKERGIFPHIL